MGLLNTIIQYSLPLVYAFQTIAPVMQMIPNSSNEKLEESIRKQFDELIKKTNIREDIQFRIMKNPGFCQAKGINFFKLGNPHILLAPKLQETDKDAFSFIAKHELSHVKHNDLFTINGVGLVAYLSIRLFMNEKTSNSLVFSYLSYILPMIPIILFSRYREKEADAFAISNSSNEELKGALYFFRASKAISSHPFLDPLHPSLDQRIKDVENALIKRNCALPDMKYGSEGFKRKSNLINLMLQTT